jgi:excisionase family DNA binding protein
MSDTKQPNTIRVASDLPEFLTVPEFCAVARVGRSAGYELARTGQIPVVRFGRLVRIPKAALLDRITASQAV